MMFELTFEDCRKPRRNGIFLQRGNLLHIYPLRDDGLVRDLLIYLLEDIDFLSDILDHHS